MKPALSLSFLILFAFLTNLPLAFSDDEAVVDSDGAPLTEFSQYYILPTGNAATGGGVRLGETGNLTCGGTVLQDETIEGKPVVFYIRGGSENSSNITTSTPVEIEFLTYPECAESSKWLVFSDDHILKYYVGIALINETRHGVTTGWFNIQKYQTAYILRFCVENDDCLPISKFDYTEDGGKRLIAGGVVPYEVKFERVRDFVNTLRSVVRIK